MSETSQADNVLDIEAEQLGKPYAQAMIGAAMKEGVADEVLRQLGEVVDQGLSQNPKLASALASPRISESDKDRVIDRLFGEQCHPVLIRTMKVMNAHGRLGFLPAVRDAGADIYDEMQGRVVAEVRTAIPLADDLRQEVRDRIGQTLGKEVQLRETVDESLIGGMIVRVGDTVFDSSVSGRLEKVRRSVREGFAQQLMQRADQFSSGTVDTADDGDPQTAT